MPVPIGTEPVGADGDLIEQEGPLTVGMGESALQGEPGGGIGLEIDSPIGRAPVKRFVPAKEGERVAVVRIGACRNQGAAEGGIVFEEFPASGNRQFQAAQIQIAADTILPLGAANVAPVGVFIPASVEPLAGQ